MQPKRYLELGQEADESEALRRDPGEAEVLPSALNKQTHEKHKTNKLGELATGREDVCETIVTNSTLIEVQHAQLREFL
jgi:hypothetical protein